MYASNEGEDWVYLDETPPIKTISQTIINPKCDTSSSTELEDDLERENRLLEMTTMEDPLLLCHHHIPQTDENLFVDNDVLNTDFDLRYSENRSRPSSHEIKPRKRLGWNQNNNDTLFSCTCLILLLSGLFILGQIVAQRDQLTMAKIAKELVKTNQRLDEIKVISIGNFEETLTDKLDKKMQNMINQQMSWYEHERAVFISQIQGLRETLNRTQRNFTDTIDHLNHENQRLQEQINVLEHRSNCTVSSRSTFDKLVKNLFQRTASIAADTSVNLSSLFERLSASVSKIVDHRHEYVSKSKRKLTDLTNAKVQTSIRRSMKNLSSSFRQAKLTYSSWIKTRAQNRLTLGPKPIHKFPWRWTFSRGSNREQVCYSKFSFPMNRICSMKRWMANFFP